MWLIFMYSHTLSCVIFVIYCTLCGHECNGNLCVQSSDLSLLEYDDIVILWLSTNHTRITKIEHSSAAENANFYKSNLCISTVPIKLELLMF